MDNSTKMQIDTELEDIARLKDQVDACKSFLKITGDSINALPKINDMEKRLKELQDKYTLAQGR